MDIWPTPGDLIAYRSVPAGPRAVVLLLHGFGEHAGRHAKTAEILATRGIAVYAYDHRGHGRSPGERAFVASFDDAVDETLVMRRRVAAEHPRLPLFLLGASMGGLMAVRSAQREPSGLRGVVLVAPAFAVDVPPLLRSVALLIARISPKAALTALDLNALSRDPAIGVAYAADPLTHHGNVPVATGAQMLRAGAAALAAAPDWHLPLYIVQGAADRIVLPAGAERFAAAAAGMDVTLRLVPDAYHEPFNDPGGTALIAEAAAWIVTRADGGGFVGTSRVAAPRGPQRYPVWQGLAFGAAVNLTARLLGTNTGRYEALKRPPFAPPGWVFPIVWGVNSALSIAANLRVLNAPPSADRTAYLRLWAATWVLYVSFGFAFFRLKSPVLGLLVTVNFLALAVLSFGRARRLDRQLGWSYVTLLPWLTLAAVVAAAVALDNPDPLLDPPPAS